MATLHVHLDESGDFKFSPKAPRYYVFAVTWTYEPPHLPNHLLDLRHKLLKRGHNLPFFHATEDKRENREDVVAILRSHGEWYFEAIVVDKPKVPPSHYDPSRFYPSYARIPLRSVLRRAMKPDTTMVIIYTDRLPSNTNHKHIEKALKFECGRHLPPRAAFYVYHHPSASNAWLQVTDYCAWAVHRKWNRRDTRFYDQLRERLTTPEREVDVLDRVTKLHYSPTGFTAVIRRAAPRRPLP